MQLLICQLGIFGLFVFCLLYSRWLFIIVLFTACVIYYLVGLYKRSSNNLPPGPFGLPFIGSIYQLKPRSFLAFQALSLQYGPIITFPILDKNIVVLNSVEAIKEAFITNGYVFSGRAKSNIVEKYFTRGKGLIFTDGELWKEHRRFTLTVLRDMGFGRSSIENVITGEIQRTCKILDDSIGKPVLGASILQQSVTNVMCKVLFGKRIDEDEQIRIIMDNFNESTKLATSTNAGVNMALQLVSNPLLNKLVDLVVHSTGLIELSKKFIVAVESIINNCQNEIVALNIQEPSSYLEAIILEKLKKESTGLPHTFDNFQINRNISELFLAGMDTTSVSLTWAMVLMSLHPKIQDRVYEELKSVLAKHDHISMKLKADCPYTCAVIEESIRYSSIVPKGLFHRAITSCNVMGYNIPKDTLVYANLYAAHHDVNIWSHADEFYPKHFLSADEQTFIPSDNVIAFSVGKRSCIGESLARTELFLFFTSLMSRYRVELHDKEKINLDDFLLGHDSEVRMLDKHSVIFNLRYGVNNNGNTKS